MKAPLCSFWVRRISRLYSIVPALNMTRIGRISANSIAETPRSQARSRVRRRPHQKGSFLQGDARDVGDGAAEHLLQDRRHHAPGIGQAVDDDGAAAAEAGLAHVLVPLAVAVDVDEGLAVVPGAVAVVVGQRLRFADVLEAVVDEGLQVDRCPCRAGRRCLSSTICITLSARLMPTSLPVMP